MRLAADSGWRCRVCGGAGADALFLQGPSVTWRQVRTSRAEKPRKLTWSWRSVFQSPYAHRLVVVISGIPDPDSAESADALGFLTSSLRSVPGVSGAVSSVDWPRSSVHWEQWRGVDHRGLGSARHSGGGFGPIFRAKADWMEGQLRFEYPISNWDYR